VIADVIIADAVTVAVPATIALGMVRILLMAQRAPKPKLPSPASIGLPSGQKAPPSAVHVALGGGRKRRWRK
jgi:hypothetical protein